jgi:hypothetical protein
MKPYRSSLISSALIGVFATVSIAASTAKADSTTYVVCNRWNECWRVHEHYTTYPSDARIVFRDEAWWQQHEHDSQWRELPDPSDDHGWYDRDGVWHPFPADVPPPR